MKQIRLSIFTILLMLFAAMPAAAQQLQKFHVESFEENQLDMAGTTKPTSRDDGTGKLYAIIKVRSTVPEDDLKAYELDFDYLKDVQEMHDGVLWVYVQYGAKTVTIKREGFYTVERYNLKTTLQPGKVYDMRIKPEPKVISMQFLMFEVTPADSKAMIMYSEEGGSEKTFGHLDGEGKAAKLLVLGQYYYRIISENYHPSEGVVTLTEPDGKHIEPVTLRPNFAHITLLVDNEADIYINKEKKGVGSWNGNLVPGTYSIECRKANHKSTTETITVIDGKNTTHALKAPTPIVGGLVLNSTPLCSNVLIDGEAAGETPLIKKGLLIGNHKITLSKDGYETATVDVVIKENETTEHNVELKKIERPVPVASQGNSQNNGSTAMSGSITSAPYKVGDYYNDGTKEGVVFEVSNGGYNGKIVSLERDDCRWSVKDADTDATSNTDGMYNMQKIRSLQNWQNDYPAFAWCASLGEGWYLPALDEVKAIYAKRAAINKTLKAKGKSELKISGYWSSTQYNESRAWGVLMNDGYAGNGNKSFRYDVRAVSAFNAKSSAISAQSNVSTAMSGSITSAPYKVGDYYNDGTKEGVVFEVSNSGYSGKIVSLNHIKSEWSVKDVKTGATSKTDGMYNMQKIRSLQNWQNDYPAFAWCASLGEGWYLPSVEELQAISGQRLDIDKTLRTLRKTEITSWYGSSTQGNEFQAWYVYMYTGYAGSKMEGNDSYVRAVSAFNAKSSAISAQSNGSTAKLGSITSAPYKVGDYYNDGKKEGVVFEVRNNGYSGKIVSLEQIECSWSEKDVKTDATSETDGMYNMQKIRSLSNWQSDYPAFAWCASLGDGWYLPVCYELKAIYAQCAAINNTLKAKGKPELENAWYWSSTQDSKFCAWGVYMDDGDTSILNKNGLSTYVRAVSAF